LPLYGQFLCRWNRAAQQESISIRKAVNAGFSLFCVQQVLGHSDPKVTQRYSHLSTKSLQDAANSASVMIRRGMPVAAVVEAVAA